MFFTLALLGLPTLRLLALDSSGRGLIHPAIIQLFSLIIRLYLFPRTGSRKYGAAIEEIVNETFSGSVGFANECIQAIKTVTAFNMKGRIEGRFALLLKNHCTKAHRAFSQIYDLLFTERIY